MLRIKKNIERGWREARRHPTVSALSGASFGIVLLGQTMAFLSLRAIQGPLVIHYTRGGIDQFGSLWQVLGYGVVGWSIIIMNYLIALELEKRDWFWGKAISGVTLGLSILLFLALRAIISVN